MKPKTRFCHLCQHHRFDDDQLLCGAGHKPRFYKPKDALGHVGPEDWGWKRRCHDFTPSK